MKIKFKKVRDTAILPQYASAGASGMDLHLCLPGMGDTLGAGEIKAMPTGLSVEIPQGYELQIRSRSGCALKGLVVANGVGTVDADYRGEIQVILMNASASSRPLSHGERVAQLVLSRVEKIQWVEASEFSDTKRGSGGFGSTGK